MPSTDITAGPWAVHRTVYHADRQCQSCSGLKDFQRSRPLYHGRHVTGTIPSKSTPAMQIGTVAHLMVFEPWKVPQEVALIPEGTERRSKAGKAAWAAFCLANDGKLLLDADDMAKCRRMADAVRSHKLARTALEVPGAKGEYPIRWRDDVSGLWVRNLIDYYAPASGFLMDLKTTSDPAPWAFAAQADTLGYHLQAALYKRGAWEAMRFDGEFLFIAVGSEEPHEVVCSVLGERTLAVARKINQALLNELSDCLRSGDWSSRYADAVQEIDLPNYSLVRQEREYE